MQSHYILGENINFTPIHRAESKWWIFHPGIEYLSYIIPVGTWNCYNVTFMYQLIFCRHWLTNEDHVIENIVQFLHM